MEPRITKKRFYVYLIFRPDGRPCYVGKGQGNRWCRHEWRSTNPHLANIIKAAGGTLPKTRIADGLTEAEAFALEKKTIVQIGREVNGGPLVNLTDGGEGVSGLRFSAEARERLSRIRLGNKSSVGRIVSPETRAKMRAAKVGRRLRPEHREKIGNALRGRKRPPEVGRKISAIKIAQAARRRLEFGLTPV